MADLPRYQRALIESPDVTATNISALVQAQARTTEAIMTGLDKLISYSIDIGEKKEAEQEKADKLLALETGISMNLEAQKQFLDIQNRINSVPGYTPAMLEAEIAHASFIFKPLEKLDKETYLNFLNTFNDNGLKLRESLNNKIIEDNDRETLKRVKEASSVYFKTIESTLSNPTFSGVDRINEATSQREKFLEYLEINNPKDRDAQIKIFDENVFLLYQNTIVDDLIKEHTDENLNLIDEGQIVDMLDSNKVGDRLQPIWDQLTPDEKNKVREQAKKKITEFESIYKQEEEAVVKRSEEIEASIYAAPSQAEREKIFNENREDLSILSDFQSIEKYVFEEQKVDVTSDFYVDVHSNFITQASQNKLTVKSLKEQIAQIKKTNPDFQLDTSHYNKLVDDISNPSEVISEQIGEISRVAYANKDGTVNNANFESNFNNKLSTILNKKIVKFQNLSKKLDTEPEVLEAANKIKEELKAEMRPEFNLAIQSYFPVLGSAYSVIYKDEYKILNMENLDSFLKDYRRLGQEYINRIVEEDGDLEAATSMVSNLNDNVNIIINLIEARDQ